MKGLMMIIQQFHIKVDFIKDMRISQVIGIKIKETIDGIGMMIMENQNKEKAQTMPILKKK